MPDGVKCYGENAAKENRELEGKQVDYCGRGSVVAILNRMAKEGLSDEVTFEQRTRGAEAGNHVDVWENQNFTEHSVQRPWW